MVAREADGPRGRVLWECWHVILNGPFWGSSRQAFIMYSRCNNIDENGPEIIFSVLLQFMLPHIFLKSFKNVKRL
jgi:hypothetical protein